MRNKLGKKITNICLIFALALSGLGGFYLLNNIKGRTTADTTFWKDYLVVKETSKYANKYEYTELNAGSFRADGWKYNYLEGTKKEISVGGQTYYVSKTTTEDTLTFSKNLSFPLYYDSATNKLYTSYNIAQNGDISYSGEFTYAESISLENPNLLIQFQGHETAEIFPIDDTTIENISYISYSIAKYPLYIQNNKFYLDSSFVYQISLGETITDINTEYGDTNLATDTSSEDIFILDNYLNSLVLQNTDNKQIKSIQGISLEFNKALDFTSDNFISTSSKAINELTIEAYLNNTFTAQYENLPSFYSDKGYGLRIDTTANVPQNFRFEGEQNNSYTNFYWKDYLDMTNVWGLTGNDQFVHIPNPAGLYTYVFSFQVISKENNILHTDNETFVYQFYLTDDGNYVEYPTMNRTEVLINNDQDYSTYYYNFDDLTYPTYTYDASKYNVSFTHVDPNGTGITYNSNFRLINANTADEIGHLNFRSNNYEKNIYLKLDKDKNRVNYYSTDACQTSDLLGFMQIEKNSGIYTLNIKGIDTYDSETGIYLKTGAKNTPISYYYNIILDELGTYEFINKYLVSESGESFKIIEPVVKEREDGTFENINLPYNIFKNKASVDITEPTVGLHIHSDVLQDMNYNENGMLVFNNGITIANLQKPDPMPTEGLTYNVHLDGGYNFVLFGTTANFYKLLPGNTTKTYTEFADIKNGVRADITPHNGTMGVVEEILKLGKTGDPYATSPLMLSGAINTVPITNLAPIYFNQFGSLSTKDSKIISYVYRWNKNLTKSPNKNGYYVDGTDIYIKGAPNYTATYITDTTCQTAGLYLIMTDIYYSTSGQTARQYYLFIIDSTTPELYYYTLDENNQVEKFSTSKTYTNVDDLYFTWAEPTYFQEDISATISYSANWDERGLMPATNYQKDTLIGGTSTSEGLYRITIYYGKKNVNGNETDRSNKNCEIKVDRTSPVASTYTFDTDMDNNPISLASDYNIFSNLFAVYSDTAKASGAEITAHYAEINFSTINNFSPTLLKDEKTITTNRKLNVVEITEDNFDIYNLNDDVLNNLKLGSDNKLSPTKLYIFKLSDEAGNEAYFYYVFDNSSPYNIIQQSEDKTTWKEAELDGNTVNETTRVFWGENKGIAVSGVLNNTKPYSIATALQYITDNTTKFKGFTLSEIDGSKYLTLPLQNANVVAGNEGTIYSGSNLVNTYNNIELSDTTFAHGIVIFPKNGLTNNVANWYLDDISDSLNDILSLNKTSYESSFYDVIGNVSNICTIYLDTDLAGLSIYNDFEDIANENEHGINKGSYNVNNLYIDYKTQIEGKEENIIRPYVTFDYYTFALSNYLTDDLEQEKTSEKIFNTTKEYSIDKLTTIYPLYPFNSSAEILGQVITPATNENDIINAVETTDSNGDPVHKTKEGLYIFKRVYHDKNGVELTDAQVKELSENDSAIIYMFVIVDRNGIITLNISTEGKVLTSSSIGDYITFLLGDGTEDKISIDAYTLNQLLSANTGNLFTTGRVVVNSLIPFDKYATDAKLNSANRVFELENNLTGIDKSKEINEQFLKLYFDLSIKVNNKSIYLIQNNKKTVDYVNYVKSYTDNSDDTALLNTIALISNGEFTATIRDYNNDIDVPTGHEQILIFTIKHEYPSGKFVSFYDDANNTKYDLESGRTFENQAPNAQYFKSINKDALSFEFEDNDDIYHAQIDPNHFIVEKGNMSNGIFTRNNYLLIVNGTTQDGKPKVETIANGANIADVLQKQQINTTTNEEDKLYRYTINIFNGYTPQEGEENKKLLSNRDEDCTYAITIYYKGSAENYLDNNGNSYFYCTYYIHQDLIAPSQNLNALKASDKGFVEGTTNIDEYFFAVNNDNSNNGVNATVFRRSDLDESNMLYLRKYTSLNEFSPSLLPGDENFGSLNTNQISFNPDVVNGDVYTPISYNSTTNTLSFAGRESGYYEVLELDEAQNITRYYIYIGNGNTNYLKFDYTEKLVGGDIKSDSLAKKINEDLTFIDAPYYTQVQLATLVSMRLGDTNDPNGTDTYFYDYKEIKDDDDNILSSIYFDKFITVKIKTGESVVSTLSCDALNETLNEFFNRVVKSFTSLQNQQTDFNYAIEILNRFGENYVLDCLLPGAELTLGFTETTDSRLFVEVPAKQGNVYLTDFIVKQGQNGEMNQISQAKNGEITSKAFDTNGLQYAKYEFGTGLYTFEIIDNFGRSSIIAKYIGADTDDDVTINYGTPSITTYDPTYGDITNTSKDVSLKISQKLYKIVVMHGEKLSSLQEIDATSRKYSVSDNVGKDGRHTYTFNNVGYYVVSYSLLASNSGIEAKSIVFNINRNLPVVFVDFESGGTRQLSNDAYSDNITIYWETTNGFEATGNIVYVSNSGQTSNIDLTGLDSFYVRDEGAYNLTITDAIGNTVRYTFTKIASSYSYFTVTADGRPLKESDYNENTSDGDVVGETTIEGDKTRLYYYVKYTTREDADGNIINIVPDVVVGRDASKGINVTLLTHAFNKIDENGNPIDGNGYYDEYEVSASNPTANNPDNSWIICYVRIVYIKQTNDFAQFTITETLDKDGKTSDKDLTVLDENRLYTSSKELLLEFNSVSCPENLQIFYGNTTRLLHYYNGTLINVIEGKYTTTDFRESLKISTAGLHTFEIFDLSDNKQVFGTIAPAERFSIYLINEVIYEINDEIPINNAYYNNGVKLSITKNLGDETIYAEQPTVVVLYNGKTLEIEPDKDGNYIFENPGYYNVTISGNWVKNSVTTPLTTSFNFTIINENVALIAFNVPTSYGFTIKSIYKNEANMSANIANPTTLWLSAGDPTFGSGLFTINASYYNQQLNKTFDFSFKVWINEETPIILPVDYTYGTKTSKVITLEYNGAIIYSQIGEGYILITNSEGNTVSRITIDSESPNEIKPINFNATNTYTVALYNKEGKLVSSYKVIKTTPLNSSAKIIIIIVTSVVAALTVVFIILRRKVKFR